MEFTMLPLAVGAGVITKSSPAETPEREGSVWLTESLSARSKRNDYDNDDRDAVNVGNESLGAGELHEGFPVRRFVNMEAGERQGR